VNVDEALRMADEYAQSMFKRGSINEAAIVLAVEVRLLRASLDSAYASIANPFGYTVRIYTPVG